MKLTAEQRAKADGYRARAASERSGGNAGLAKYWDLQAETIERNAVICRAAEGYCGKPGQPG